MNKEQDVTDSLLSHEHLTADPEIVLAALHIRLAWRKRTTTATAASTAVVVVAAMVAFVLVLTTGWPRLGRSSTTPAAPKPLQPTADQAGHQRISYHGATFFVPAHFVVNTGPCYVARADSLELETVSGAVSCPFAGPAVNFSTLTVIAARPADTNPDLDAASTHLTIDGAPALRGERPGGGANGTPATVIVVPNANLSIEITGPTRQATANSLLKSMKVGATDDLGCAAHVPEPTPLLPPPSGDFVPQPPVGGVVCGYAATEPGSHDQWLAGSRVLTGAEVASLSKFVNDPLASSSTFAVANLSDEYRLIEPAGATVTIATSFEHKGLVISDGKASLTFPNFGTNCARPCNPPAPSATLPGVYGN